MEVLKMFSVPSNVEILVHKDDGGSFQCLGGIRFFTAAWIMMYHTYYIQPTWVFHRFRKFSSTTNSVSFKYFILSFVFRRIKKYCLPCKRFEKFWFFFRYIFRISGRSGSIGKTTLSQLSPYKNDRRTDIFF